MGQVRVGTASWTGRTLLESGWYPPEADTPEKRLRFYARQLALVEADATYYTLPAPLCDHYDHLHRWPDAPGVILSACLLGSAPRHSGRL